MPILLVGSNEASIPIKLFFLIRLQKTDFKYLTPPRNDIFIKRICNGKYILKGTNIIQPENVFFHDDIFGKTSFVGHGVANAVGRNVNQSLVTAFCHEHKAQSLRGIDSLQKSLTYRFPKFKLPQVSAALFVRSCLLLRSSRI